MTRFISKKWPPYLLLGLATLLVWGHTVMFGFVWDDTFFIRDLQSVRSVKNIPAMFCSIEAQATEPYLFRVYRPIRTAHYALLHALDGHEVPQPWVFHLANVLWHGATAMMLFSALGLLLPKLRDDWGAGAARQWALLVALGFAVHPVVSEVVCWAKSLDDILAAFFTLACLRELLLPVDNRAARWRGLLWFALAVYSKESAVPFAVFPFVIYRNVHKLSWRVAAQGTAVYLLVAFVYMAHRSYIIERSSQTEPLSGSYAQTLLDMFPVVPQYCRLLLGIPPFLCDYKFMKGGFTPGSPEVLGGLLLLLGLVIGGLFAWRRPGFKAVGFGLLWTGLFLLPVSNVLPMMQYMAERFLYLPLIGWLLAVAALAAMIPRKPTAQIATVCLIVLWGVTAWGRSWIWQDELTLFVRTYLEGPPTPRVEHNAVSAILHLPHVSRVFKFDEATDKLSYMIPDDPALQQQVLETFKQSFHLFPRDATLLSCYGIALATTGHPDRAIFLFESAVRLKPKNTDYWLNLGRAALSAGQFDKARFAKDKAVALSPNHPVVFLFQAELEWEVGDYSAARAVVLRWREVSPNAENAKLLADIEAKLAEKNSH